jgi:hypothetical protein
MLVMLTLAIIHWPFMMGRAYAQSLKPVVMFRDVKFDVRATDLPNA